MVFLMRGFTFLSRRNRKHLEALGITHVLNMADELENAFPEVFTYKKCGVNDTVENSNFPNFFRQALEFIGNFFMV